MVADGSVCGAGGICRGGACVPISDVALVPNCPSNNNALVCSGHGVCTTLEWCYCEHGFTGEDCGRISVTSPAPVFLSPESPRVVGISGTQNNAVSTSPQRLDTTSMLIILGGVAGAIALLLLFMLLCYRRRSSSHLSDKKLNGRLGKDTDAYSESSVDTAQRSIKFGHMPSYRDEKRWRRKQRHQLHKIHEVSDERDSVSNKSSAAASLASAATATLPTDPNFSFGPVSYSNNDRSILKRQDGSTTPLLPRPCDLSVRDESQYPHFTEDNGYDSEPPRSLRIFEESLRHLERCGPYQNNNATSPHSDISRPTHPGQLHPRRPMQMAVFSPQSTPRNVSISAARGGYSTDTEIGYTPYTPRRTRAPSDGGSRISPSNSVASSSSRGMLGRPAPLKLRNIEYLLKQLDTGNNAHSISPTSSAELSATEADFPRREEEGSNTESSKDPVDL